MLWHPRIFTASYGLKFPITLVYHPTRGTMIGQLLKVTIGGSSMSSEDQEARRLLLCKLQQTTDTGGESRTIPHNSFWGCLRPPTLIPSNRPQTNPSIMTQFCGSKGRWSVSYNSNMLFWVLQLALLFFSTGGFFKPPKFIELYWSSKLCDLSRQCHVV